MTFKSKSAQDYSLDFNSFTFSITSLSLALSISLIISSCTLGPDFKSPESPDTNRYTVDTSSNHFSTTSSESGAAQSISIEKELQGEWWTLFKSKALTQLIAQALEKSPNLQAASYALTQAQENTIAMQGSLFPALDLVTRSTQQKISGAQFGNPSYPGTTYTLSSGSVQVAYTLDVFGGIRRQIESLEAEENYQRFQLEGAFLTLASNVASSAIQEASLRAQIKATEEIISSQTHQLELVKRQYDLGGVSKINVLALQATLEQTCTTLPPLQLQLAKTRHRLTVLVGDLPSTKLSAEFNLTDLHLPEELPLSLPSKLVQQRPDIKAQEALLHDASAQIGVATANLLPNFTINANAGTIATRLADLFVPGSIIWSFGGNMLQPVFHGGALLHKRRAALAAYEQSAAQYKSTVLLAFQNVADTLSALDLDATALKTQDTALQATLDSLELTRQQYQVGAISYLSLLIAEQNYQKARMGQIIAQANRYTDTVTLFQALGGGWWKRPDLSNHLIAEQQKTSKH